MACFLYQQGAEKLLKAVLYVKGERPVVGHATTHLAERCAAYKSAFRDLLEPCRELDIFYIPTRYPNGVPDGARTSSSPPSTPGAGRLHTAR